MFALRAACSGVRGAASSSSGVLLRSATAALLPLPSALPAAAASSLFMRSTGAIASASVRHSSSATAFHMKKQKEWRTRAARGFAPMKTHAGCKKRFRFVSRFAVVCKHSGKYHKNYHKSHTRLHRLRKMKIVPRHLVKRLKVMMPYWKNQMRKEQQLATLATETSVTKASDISFQRQRVFIQAQRERLMQQLVNPRPYFVRPAAAQATQA